MSLVLELGIAICIGEKIWGLGLTIGDRVWGLGIEIWDLDRVLGFGSGFRMRIEIWKF